MSTTDSGLRARAARRHRCPVQRVLAGVLLVALVPALVAGALAYRAVFHPNVDEPLANPDALLVLGPVDAKLGPAVDLARTIGAGTLLVSDQYLEDRGTGACRPEVEDLLRGYGAREADYPADIACFLPVPVTTQGEAMHVAGFGAARDWDSVTVMAHAPHVERARTLLRRCWSGKLAVTAVELPMGAGQAIGAYVYESGARLKAALTPSCDGQLPRWLQELGWRLSSTDERLDPGSRDHDGP